MKKEEKDEQEESGGTLSVQRNDNLCCNCFWRTTKKERERERERGREGEVMTIVGKSGANLAVWPCWSARRAMPSPERPAVRRGDTEHKPHGRQTDSGEEETKPEQAGET